VFQAPATAYDRHVGRYSRELARALIEAAGIAPEQTAVDVGCGPGGLTAELAERLGAEHVAAVDPSASFVEACARRLPGVRVEQARAESLPFADGEFDRALAQLVVNFMADAPAGVREMRRVTRSGGVVAAAVWDYAGEMTLLRRFWDAAVALDPSAAESDEGRSMRYCEPGSLQGLWEDAGLDEVEVGQAVVSAPYESFADLWAPLETGVGPSGAYVAVLEPSDRAALAREVYDRLGAPAAGFRLTARAWTVTGRVP
jgi:SAM-dependent methyltransferase